MSKYKKGTLVLINRKGVYWHNQIGIIKNYRNIIKAYSVTLLLTGNWSFFMENELIKIDCELAKALYL